MKRTTPLAIFSEGLCWAAAISVARLAKFSFVVGSAQSGFSGLAVLSPLTGAFSSLPGISLLLISQLLYNGLNGFSFLHLLAFGLPGVCAALYWSVESNWYRVGVPALCIALFVANPVGFYAAPYACLWAIPMVIAFMGYESFFTHALSSTFTAHAVGSVVWLYTMDLSSATWLALTPVAFVERILFASAATLLFYGFSSIKKAVAKRIPLFA